jgi:hypothetical protein
VLNVRVLVEKGHHKVIGILEPLVLEYRQRGALAIAYHEVGGSGPLDRFRRLLTEPTDLLIVDGHGWYEDGIPMLMGVPLPTLLSSARRLSAHGLALGACHGGSDGFVTQLRSALASPMAFLGCSELAPYEHGKVLWRELFKACQADAGVAAPITTDRLARVMLRAQEEARAARPGMHWHRWLGADVVRPVDPA